MKLISFLLMREHMQSLLNFAYDIYGEDSVHIHEESSYKNDHNIVGELSSLSKVHSSLVEIEIKTRLLEKHLTTSEFGHISELDSQLLEISYLIEHFKDLIENKEQIIAHLQQPFMGDSIVVEPEYQREFETLCKKINTGICSLSIWESLLEKWKICLLPESVTSMDQVMGDLCTGTAKLQTYADSLSVLQETLQKILNKYKQ